MNPVIGKLLVVSGLVLAVAGAVLVTVNLRKSPLPAGTPGSVISEGAGTPLPRFELSGPLGRFGNRDLRGRWTFMFFGYTRCPDVCPTALSLMKEVKAGISAVSPAPTFQVVFVSVDPKRDTDALLKEYLAAFDPSFIGLSGEDAALAPLAESLRVRFHRNDETDARNYTVDHSAAIHLIDPEGRLARTFPPPQQVSGLVAELLGIARP